MAPPADAVETTSMTRWMGRELEPEDGGVLVHEICMAGNDYVSRVQGKMMHGVFSERYAGKGLG
jgi:hypothetical protein